MSASPNVDCAQHSVIQHFILEEMANLQCYASDEFLAEIDEASVMTYKRLGTDKFTLKELKPAMLALRNEQLVELVTAFDRDYQFRAGSGYVLTAKGRSVCESEGLHEDYCV